MEAIQQVLGVVAVLALLGGSLWWLRRKGLAQFAVRGPGGSRTKSMRVIERLALTPQHSLYLVRVADRTLLIAASPGGCSILDGVAESANEGMALR
jgi:flagellar biosynthetic protein FliO